MLVADLVEVRPAPPASASVAWRSGLTVLVALLVLVATDRLEWAAYASFGAFASVFGGRAPHATRWRSQAAMGALLAAAAGCGTVVALSPHRASLAVPVTAAWAVLGAVLSDRRGWLPPGPFFVVFAVATASAIPADGPTVLAAVLVAAGAAALATALGMVEAAVRTHAAAPAPPPAQPRHRQRVHAVRCGGAVALAGSISTGVGLDHPYWAMVASVVPLATVGLRPQVLRGVHRVAGTLVGLALAAVLLLPTLPRMAVALVVAVLQGLTELSVARHYGLALVFITPLSLLVVELSHPQPTGALLLSRLVETAIGVSVGIAAAWITRVRPLAGAGAKP